MEGMNWDILQEFTWRNSGNWIQEKNHGNARIVDVIPKIWTRKFSNTLRHWERVPARVKIFFGAPPTRVSQQKIFTLTWKDRLSVAEWLGFGLKRLICTANRQWHYQERRKHMQHNWAPFRTGLRGNLYRLPPVSELQIQVKTVSPQRTSVVLISNINIHSMWRVAFQRCCSCD
jgi:hypothetical protein